MSNVQFETIFDMFFHWLNHWIYANQQI